MSKNRLAPRPAAVSAVTSACALALASFAAATPASASASSSAPATSATRGSGSEGAERNERTRRTIAPTIAGYKHLVVIYQENHSFDNLYGTWGAVGDEMVDGLAGATPAKTTQIAQDGTAYTCLPQNDPKLTSPPVPVTCTDSARSISSGFTNKPFLIDTYIPATDLTRDLVHRFYQEKYQINGGAQNRYVTGSDALGLAMGVYDTKGLPIYRYLHSKGAPNYVVADRFFQAANGGSFLNHQYLIAARAPYDASNGALGAVNSVIDSNGMPTSYPLYKATGPVLDKQLTVACSNGAVIDYVHACGNIAVNTVQPASKPYGAGARIGLVDDAAYPNIGDRLSAKGVSWAWYSGGWADAEAGKAGPLFQYHHQPFNYFANYAPGQPGRAHLKDETEFMAAAKAGTLPTVSFVKPYGVENEHPGYASEAVGSDHLVNLIQTITSGPEAASTLIVVTYDEFGGQWDHVSPPGAGSSTTGAYDAWGPGTRIPALVISSSLRKSSVDHTVYDTTSILATIERSLGLAPLSTRDAVVSDLRPALVAGNAQPPRNKYTPKPKTNS